MQRTLAEILVFVVVSAVITVGTAVVGARLVAPSPTTSEPSSHVMGMACLDEPFVSIHGRIVGAMARLCLGDGIASPRIELTGLTSGTLLSAWLAYGERRSATPQARCSVNHSHPDAPWPLPRLIDTTVADHTGRVELTSTMPGLRFAGGSEVQVLTVEHGWQRPERRAAIVELLRIWQDGWTTGEPTATIGSAGIRGWVVGCATFRPPVGLGSLED
jgi:hypothetical protein